MEEVIRSINIHLGDCVDGLDKCASNSIDCVITSPPYKDEDGYSEALIIHTFTALYYTMREGGLMFVNFGHLVEDKARPFRLALLIEKTGFDLQETFVWAKNHYRPIQGRRRVNNLTEFIFMFSKGLMPTIDRLAIGVPYADKTNVGRYATSDLKCAGNLWHIPYETIQSEVEKLHNDRFPIELPTRCLKLADAKPGFLVCDPFSGSGTTALACKNMGLNFIGWEINPIHYKTAMKRLGK
jgi:site-specific DNA-methyltransferase (adenine-specific)